MRLSLPLRFDPLLCSISPQNKEHGVKYKLDDRLRVTLYFLVDFFDNVGRDEVELIDDVDDVEHGTNPSPSEEVGACLRAELFRHSDLNLFLSQCFTLMTCKDFS